MNNTKNKSVTLEEPSQSVSSNKRLLILLIPVIGALLITVVNKMHLGTNMMFWQALAPIMIVGAECVALLLFIKYINRHNKS